MNRRDYLKAASSMLTLAAVPAARATAESPATTYSPQINYRVRIPMRDGVKLGATLFLPRGLDKPRPAIFSHTPYTADLYHPEGAYFSTQGYPYLAVDMRGRGDSEGVFAPFGSEIPDAHDIVEWIAKQPFCNGKVAGNGHSWVGYTQWAAVRGGATSLATIVPLSSPWVGLDFPINNNIFYAFAVPWLAHTDGHTQRNTMMRDGLFQVTEQMRFLESGLPFRKMDQFYGIESKPFQEWVSHPRQDDYWDARNPTPEQLAGLTMPVLTMCGYFDGDQPGALEFYRQHTRLAGAKARHYLVMGPWGHDQVRKPEAEFFGIKVGADSVIDALKLHRDWFAFAMEDGPQPDFLKKWVAYYVMGADKWRYADTLDGITARYETLHLGAEGNPHSAYRAGTLGPRPAGKAVPSRYVYDPRDMSGLILELSQTQSHLIDQTALLTDATDKLVFQSAPFETDTEISGTFKFAAWIALDQPDTDFLVSIHDIAPDGTSMFMTDHRMRARHREGLRTEKLIATKAPLRYDFDRFAFVSRQIKAGNRIRLVLRAHQGIAWQRSYNSGKPVADETRADARTVTVRLFHDAAHPSALSVPIAQADV
jgi:putative CocE/NonD family hydrolase